MPEGPLLGLTVTLVAYAFSQATYRRYPTPLTHPLLLATALIVLGFKVTGLSLDLYQPGGEMIRFFLGPATVALAVPFYKQLKVVRPYALGVIAGTFTGALVGVVSVVGLAALFGGSPLLQLSLAPKSVTAPIAIELSNSLGGFTPVTLAAVILAGNVGALYGRSFLRRIGVKDPVAQATGIGAGSHALGTATLLQEGELLGGVSGVALALTGIFTSVLAPLLLGFLFQSNL